MKKKVPRPCADCGTPTMNAYRCDACIQEAIRRDNNRWKTE